MSQPDNSESSANPIGAGLDGTASSKAELPHVESPAVAPDHADIAATGSTEAEIASPQAPEVELGPSGGRTDGVRSGQALVLAIPQVRADAAPPEPAATEPGHQIRVRTLAATVMAAAVLGGLAGALATAGIAYWEAPQSAAPSYAALAESLGRVDHELSVLKASVDTSTKAASLQVGKITERIDRVEKAQADSGTKLAKAADSLDRVERRLTTAPGDVTGSIAEPRAAAPSGPDMKRTALAPGPGASSAPIVEGWVLRDVFNGAAMIQGRAGVIEVVPGDNLPGLGRIESVKRQDGRWVVVTSRGLIVSR